MLSDPNSPERGEKLTSPQADGTQGLHGRRKGKRLRPGQQDLMASLLPRLRVPLGAPGALDPLTLFPSTVGEAWLEIGYGGGEHLIAQAQANPAVGLIGCEFFENGIAKVLRRIDTLGLNTVRLHDHDARDMLNALQEASIARAFLLFPDPWPKTRHHKRRFVQPDTLDALARALKPGGLFRFATDIPDYTFWTLSHMRRASAFEWLAERPGDWRARAQDWSQTRYEAKALKAGRKPVYLTFRRR